MAHRTNVTPVGAKIEPSQPTKVVTDPVCGKAIQAHQARHLLFRRTDTYYFCSKECRMKFESQTG